MSTPTAITLAESVRLVELERIIDRGKQTFVEVGTALAEIRDSRFYRNSHATFEDYCAERWGWSKRSAYQFIAAAEAVENVRNCAHTEVLPATESQARPLTKLPAEQQPAAWEKAVEKAAEEGKPVAARHVEEAVAEVLPPTKPTRVGPYKPDLAGDCWMHARLQLDRIHANDTSRERVLREVITYCESRISEKR